MAVAHDAASESHTGTTGSVSEASFSWSHNPVGTPRGVLVYVFNLTNATDFVTSVTYDGVALTQVVGGQAVDAANEPMNNQTWFLGSSVPATDPATVVVTRTNNTAIMWAVAITVTAGGDTEVTGIVLLQDNQALAEQSVDDGSPGSDSVRYAGTGSGLFAPPTVGANSTLLHDFDPGAVAASVVRETTAGQGARLVGWTAADDDVAAVHLAIRQVVGGAVTGTIAVTQDNQTAAFAGTVLNPITGTIGVTQGDQTAAFVGSLGISGTIASTQQDQTAAFTGAVMGADWDCGDWDPLDWATDCAPTGVLAAIQDNQIAAFTGTVANPVSGTIGVTQQDQMAVFLGTTVSDGTLSSIQDNQTATFVGTVANPITGTIAVTQTDQIGALTGTVTAPAVTGTIAVTQQDQVGAFVGQSLSPSVTGTIAVTQADQTMAAAGIVAMAVTGTIAATQADQVMNASGIVVTPLAGLVSPFHLVLSDGSNHLVLT